MSISEEQLNMLSAIYDQDGRRALERAAEELAAELNIDADELVRTVRKR